MKRKRNAPKAPSAHSGDGWSAVCAASTIAAAGSTIRFGITFRSKSVTEIATSAAQNSEATAASAVSPKARTHAPISSAVTSSTSGYFHGTDVPQCRQRARRSAHETIGTLSYHASGVSHAMHADPGCTTERRSGTRAATTLRKLPSASPGTKAIAASAAPTITPIGWAHSTLEGERARFDYGRVMLRRTMSSVSLYRCFASLGVRSTGRSTEMNPSSPLPTAASVLAKTVPLVKLPADCRPVPEHEAPL